MSHNPNETTEHIVSNMINWSDKVIKSQHELNTCNDGKRSSDVLLSTIEELKKTKKQLECGVNRELLFLKKIEKLEKQLDIAVKGIKAVLDDEIFCGTADGGLVMYLYTALERIEELNK